MAKQEDLFKNVVSHAKEYGFIFPSSEVYDGLSAVYDYAQNGVELKKNIREYWWKSMVQMNENIVGLDAAILMHPTTWKASGHVDAFNDPLIDNKDSKKRYRADVLVEEFAEKINQKAQKEIEKAKARFGDAFNEQEIACFEGNASLSTALLKLPFDHIFFTGSTEVGKVVMEAAAKNLTSVTLELGGKSPTIIDENADLAKAAEKIAWGKLVNSGQTCIAPDYVFVHEQQLDEFIGLYKAAANRMYFKTADKIDSQAYGKIISIKHFKRLKALVNDAVDNGARIDFGGTFDEDKQTINPIVLSKISAGAKVMEEEIFGPILPILTYKNLDEVIDQINAKSKPLALYIFSKSSKNIKRIIKNTSAGGTCINDVLIHISNPKLPFGGVSNSGMGSSHGAFGFKNFSHERAVMFQRSLDFNKMIYPPYGGKEWVLKVLKKIM